MTRDFTVFDSKSRVVEPPELWDEYLDPEYRTRQARAEAPAVARERFSVRA
jgi:hypothetical protein